MHTSAHTVWGGIEDDGGGGGAILLPETHTQTFAICYKGNLSGCQSGVQSLEMMLVTIASILHLLSSASPFAYTDTKSW